MLRKKLTLALILYPSQRFSLWFFERIRCAVVKMMPVLSSSSHRIHKPQQLPNGFPSADINQKIRTWSAAKSLSANIIQQTWFTTYVPTKDESLMTDLAAWTTALFADSRIGWRCGWLNRHEGATLRLCAKVKRWYRRPTENRRTNCEVENMKRMKGLG